MNLGGGRYSLTILEATPDDFGIYSVIAYYDGGEDTTCSAIIRRAVIVFKRQCYSQPISVGDMLHLVVEVEGQPIKVEVGCIMG